MNSNSPIVKHLVLVGGGHSHLAVLRAFGMKPVPGLAITLITREVVTPYSGSLPGYLAGFYTHDQMHIDLLPLARFAGARLIQDEVTEIDLNSKVVRLDSRPDIPFDIVSLNIGSRPESGLINGAEDFAVPVKPIDAFIEHWEAMKNSAINILKAGDDYRLAIVGGGPASVELAFATHFRLCQELEQNLYQPGKLKIKLITADEKLLDPHNSKVSEFARAELERRQIEILFNHKVENFAANKLISSDGTEVEADFMVYATGASIPQWPFQCGLKPSDDGFIEIRPTLQSSSHDFVFAAGDAATIRGEPRPKSGVYAVRQGKVLAENLKRYATGGKLSNYFPQKQALALMSMGDSRAIASRGQFFFHGRLMWTLKHQIDSRFVRKYSTLPEMQAELALEPGLVDSETEQKLRQHAMRCAGCGAKVAADVLAEVLDELPNHQRDDVMVSAGGIEDASRIRLADGKILLQSVDHLKAPFDDPFLFAQIATNHCLSDIYAMGVQPHSALAIVGVPQANKRYARQQLRELMHGCARVLEQEQCSLVGGHSAETESLQFGLCVNGFANEPNILSKDRATEGEVLVLTKALGTGTLLAADMRYQARYQWVQDTITSMLISNRSASELIVAHGASSCTDITGFGLAGHLLEVLQASKLGAEINLASIPAITGALQCLENGIYSSLHQDNSLVEASIHNADQHAPSSAYQLLFDPQTAGGLLASMSEAAAKKCIKALQKSGYPDACIIGRLRATDTGEPGITLT
ncbi:MAG: selenide, water dikinase SelD [Gammaproteobacteria bacterium]